jgi:tetratricopeptide (TPR) repeat protein
MTSLCLGQNDAQNARYKTFLDNFRSGAENQRAAYQAAREYMRSSPRDPQIAAYVSNWIAKYEAASREFEVVTLAFRDKKYSEAIRAGKSALATDPDNLRLLYALAFSAYEEHAANSSASASFQSDAVAAAMHGISLIKAGKPAPAEAPFNGGEQMQAQLNFFAGALKSDDQPEQAVVLLSEGLQHKSYLSSRPEGYLLLVRAYYKGPYKSAVEAYNRQFGGKPKTEDSQRALERVNELVDRIIDSYARALAYAAADQYKEQRGKWLDEATELYKTRHDGSSAGLEALLSSIKEKAVPDPPAFVSEGVAGGAR